MNFRIFLFLGIILLTVSCARRGRPEGGPKDEDKPIMVKTEPAFKSLHFDADEIKIYFDEYIKLTNVTTQLIISPPLKYPPIISPQGTPSKKITIKIKDTLRENTTYTFNFGQSVVDNTEGNVLENFKYIFSTGDYIDSLEVKGTIKDAFDLKMIENPTLMLYEVIENFNDSIIFNDKPMYVGSTIDSVNWNISNIKAGEYLLVALNDRSKNYKYNIKEDKIGFHSTYINVPTDSTYDISLFSEILPLKIPSKPKEISKGHIIFGYEGDGKDLEVIPISKTVEDYKSFSSFDTQKDTLHYWYKNYSKDSIIMAIVNKTPIDTANIKLKSKEIDSIVVSTTTNGVLHLRDTLKITSNVPFMDVDTAKVYFINKDSVGVKYNPVISKNRKSVAFNFEKELQNSYRAEFLPGAFTGFFNNVNDTLKVKFVTKKTSNYSSISLSLNNVKSYPIIIHLIDSQGKVVENKYAETAREYKFNNLLPSKYKVRIIFDSNKNKKWDTGSYFAKRQAEEVYYFNGIIEAKANWEVIESFSIK